MTEPNVDPNVDPNADPNAGKSFADTIPEAYRETSWAKDNAADPETFFKFVDNQNTLVGKKGVIIPEAGAPETEMSAHYNALGRPETPEGYDTPPIEEMKDVQRDEAVLGDIKKLFHTAGISKTAATKVSQGFEKILYDRGKEAVDKKIAEDKAFVDHNTKLFGDKKDTIVANAQKIIRETVPAAVVPAFDKLDGEAMSVVVAIADSLYTKYGKEDDFRGGGGDGATGGDTFEECSNQQRELMKNPAFLDTRHPDHEGLRIKNTAIMAKMRALKP